MITDLKNFKIHLESLSTDRANKAKLDLLIQTAKEMVDAYAKSEAFEIAKKAKNEEIKKLLNDLGTHSIVCKGTLIEVIGVYDNHTTNLTDYTTFVEQSVATLGKQYKEMHDKIKAASTEVTAENEYLRFNKNPKNIPTGTMEGIGSTIKGWLSSFKNWVIGFLPKAKQEINFIKAELQKQLGLNDKIYGIADSKVNESSPQIFTHNIKFTWANNSSIHGDYFFPKNGEIFFGRILDILDSFNIEYEVEDESDENEYTRYNIIFECYSDIVHNKIIPKLLPLFKKNECFELYSEDDSLNDYFMGTYTYESVINEATFKSKYKQKIFDVLSTNPQLDYLDLAKACGFKPEDTSSNYSLYANLIKLLQENIVTRVRDGKKFIYSLVSLAPRQAIPATSKVDIVEPIPVDNAVLQETLAKASELISDAEQEVYFLELAKIKEKQVIAMLNDFKSKKLAIDDKVLQLIKVSAGARLNKAEFMDKMTDANVVTEAIADMASNLFAIYTKSFQAAESVRQHKDETGLPEGTLGATFDWIMKKVVPGEPNIKENVVIDFFKNIGRKLKQYISNFNILSKRTDMALSHI